MLQKERKYKNLLKLWLKLDFITFLKRKSKQMTQQEEEKKNLLSFKIHTPWT